MSFIRDALAQALDVSTDDRKHRPEETVGNIFVNHSQPPSCIRTWIRRSVRLRLLSLLSLVLALPLLLRIPTSNLFKIKYSTTISEQHLGTLLEADPASEWQDNVWPLRPPTPWDISTDFPYPRTLTYNVTEGTWLRLDVHPKSGDIIFDMVGDLYCLPGARASAALDVARGGAMNEEMRVHAITVTRGVPYDSDPHFSPEGDRVVFRSDAELGVENIWVMRWAGCEAMGVGSQSSNKEILVGESEGRRTMRLSAEGRAGGAYLSTIKEV